MLAWRLALALLGSLLGSGSSLRIKQFLETSEEWLPIGSFCYLPNGGNVDYHLRYPSTVSLPLVLFIYHQDTAKYVDKNQTEAVTWLSEHAKAGAPCNSDPEVDLLQKVVLDESYLQSGCAESENETLLCRGKVSVNIQTITCLSFAISYCQPTANIDLKIDLSLTNNDDTHFFFHHFSADDISTLLVDVSAFGFGTLILLWCLCIRQQLRQYHYYQHPVGCCLLSLGLLLATLAIKVGVSSLYALSGRSTGNVHVIVHCLIITAHALFVQGLFLDALKHTWCNDQDDEVLVMRRGSARTLVSMILAGFYGTALGTLYMYDTLVYPLPHFFFDKIAGYAVLGMRGLAWLVFIITAIVSAPSPKAEKKQGNDFQGNSGHRPRLRSLFGDYDYTTTPVKSSSPLPPRANLAEEEDIGTSLSTFEQVPDPPGPAQQPISIDVRGHQLVAARQLSVCQVFVYSLWFLAVPLMAIWSPHLLPGWLAKQLLYAADLGVVLLGYLYFLAHSMPLAPVAPVATAANTHRPRLPQPVEHLTVL